MSEKEPLVGDQFVIELEAKMTASTAECTCSEVADHLRNKCAVVLNLESTNKDTARRLVDFLSGCAYAVDGKIKKVAISTYIITPYNVDIVGDLMEEIENSGVYF